MKRVAALCVSLFFAICVHAQPASRTAGTTLVIPANGEVTRANDEARATFAIEEQDKEKSAAASRVNQKMKEGVEVLKRGDPQAKLRTRGYYTYPVYAEQPPRPAPQARPQVVGWRVGQYVDLTTTNLAALPATVAAAQRILTLNGLSFGLSRAAQRGIEMKAMSAAAPQPAPVEEPSFEPGETTLTMRLVGRVKLR